VRFQLDAPSALPLKQHALLPIRYEAGYFPRAVEEKIVLLMIEPRSLGLPGRRLVATLSHPASGQWLAGYINLRYRLQEPDAST
jgi:hypothetical protein